MSYRRRRGATLGLVAACVLVVIVIGVGCYFLSKIIGGGREVANATDSGNLNMAKQAIRNPSKAATAFANPDVGNNFKLLGDGGETLDLLVYNRCVAQAALVALNAQEENTGPALNNARRIWTAANDVGQFLRSNFSDANYMAPFFQNLARSNNRRMMGNNDIAMGDYGTSFMKPGYSANVAFSASALAAFSNANLLPLNSGGAGGAGGTYMAGYQPFTIAGLTFCAVPVFPNEKPHLVSLADFTATDTDGAETGAGYPADTLPPNAFKAVSSTLESKSNTMTGAVSCAIVGCVTNANSFPADLRNGYIVIKNGPKMPGTNGAPLALSGPDAAPGGDIFSHELMNQVTTLGAASNDPFTNNQSLWDDWYKYNTQGGAQPSMAQSQIDFRKGDQTVVTLSDMQRITTASSDATSCIFWDYTDPMSKPLCLSALPNFKAGYGRPGTNDFGNIAPSGFTALEQFKVDVLASRVDATTCRSVSAPAGVSGVKWFDHSKTYPAPSETPYNFGVPKSPYEYLLMIDSVSAGCANGPIMTSIVKRCQQIVPGVSSGQVQAVLSSMPLELDQTLYVYRSGGGLTMSGSLPPGYVGGTSADGTGVIPPCGDPYGVIGNLVNVTKYWGNSGSAGQTVISSPDGDGNFPGYPYGTPQAGGNLGQCTDKAYWTPSTGFNNLLGELKFTNSCEGGGSFCQPN